MAKTLARKKSSVVSLKTSKALKALKEHFGFSKFRPGQEEVIDHVLRGRNTLAILPTGAGKSLCYQLPGILLEGTTVVVSPLIALMKDQHEKLNGLELSAASLNSSIPRAEQKAAVAELNLGKTEYVYVTPERLTNADFLAELKKIKIDLFVVDEAHCISHWGHDFRPAYLALKPAIRSLGNPPVLALTATATEDVAKDIKEQLGLETMEIVSTGVMRKNLFYEAFLEESEEAKRTRLLEILREVDGPAIVYTSTVKLADELQRWLSEQGFDAMKYHSRLAAKVRNSNQELFMSAPAPVMIATSAFGLGIDKPNIRSVVHFNFPGSLDAYYQESGRAGRDGKAARCSLIYLKRDKSVQSFFMAGKYPKAEEVEAVFKVLLANEEGAVATPSQIAEQLPGVSKRKLASVLRALENMNLVRSTRRGVKVLKALKASQAGFVSDQYREMLTNDQEKLKAIIVYAQTALCRWKSLLHYFGEKNPTEGCQHCDNCLKLGVVKRVHHEVPAEAVAIVSA